MLVYVSRYTRVEDLMAYCCPKHHQKGPETDLMELDYLQTSESDVFFICETDTYDVEHQDESLSEGSEPRL